VNNAGIMAVPYAKTKDGIESQFGVNHMGHFVFTQTLLPTIMKSQPSRIVNVTSDGHQMAPAGGIDFETLDENKHGDGTGIWTRYGRSKIANILFTKALAKRLEGEKIYVNAVHPGHVDTELVRGPAEAYGKWLNPVMAFGAKLFAASPATGALTQIYLATSPEIEEKDYRGLYFVPTAKEAQPSADALNAELAEKLWKYSEDLAAEKLKVV
jgi:NAD(P)-dependent dehydrogenase (short-subunit alcohol dehydrogenase family)